MPAPSSAYKVRPWALRRFRQHDEAGLFGMKRVNVYRTRLAARRGVLTCLSRGTGVQVGAIFDVRALLTPPLAAERMVQLSTRMSFRAEVLP
jgi:hypothetical protein